MMILSPEAAALQMSLYSMQVTEPVQQGAELGYTGKSGLNLVEKTYLFAGSGFIYIIKLSFLC